MMELNKEALKGHIDTIILSILNEKVVMDMRLQKQ